MKTIYLTTKELSNFKALANKEGVMFEFRYDDKINLVEVTVSESFVEKHNY